MRIIALDPSSTAIGYAIAEGQKPLDAGVIRVPGKHDAIDRLQVMVDELDLILRDEDRDDDFLSLAIVETPAPQQPGRLGAAMARGQATYGMAVGCVLCLCRLHALPAVYVRADKWTRRRSKDRRAAEMQALHPNLDWSIDSGGDMADAVGLLEWYMTEYALRSDSATGYAATAAPKRGANPILATPTARRRGCKGDMP